jgi:integrase
VASIVALGDGKTKSYRLDVCLPKGFPKRRAHITLGKCGRQNADRFRTRIEALVPCRKLGQPLDNETATWLASLPDETHRRLVECGLADPRGPAGDAPPLGEYLDRILHRKAAEVKPRSLELLEQTKAKLLAYFDADARIADLSTDDAADWRATLLEAGLAEATVRMHTRNAKSILQSAVDSEVLARNPFRLLPSTAIAASRDRYVEPAEAARILDAIPGTQQRVLFALARYGGLRVPSETHSLKWSDIDFDNRVALVYAPKAHRRHRPEEDAVRAVPIDPRLYDLLLAAFDEAEPGTRHVLTISRNNLHRTLKAAIRAAGLKPWPDSFQTLRRSRETEWSEGFPSHAVSAWLGHSQEVSRRHYLQVTDEMMRRASGRPAAQQNAQQQATESTGNDGKESNTGSDADAGEMFANCVAAGGCAPFPVNAEWPRPDSNRGPSDYESPALTAELRGLQGGMQTRHPVECQRAGATDARTVT